MWEVYSGDEAGVGVGENGGGCFSWATTGVAISSSFRRGKDSWLGDCLANNEVADNSLSLRKGVDSYGDKSNRLLEYFQKQNMEVKG